MADDFAGLGASVNNQVAEILVVFLDGSLSAAHGDSFVEKFCDRKRKDSLLRVLAVGAGIRGDINTDDTDASRRVNYAHAVFENLRCFFFL